MPAKLPALNVLVLMPFSDAFQRVYERIIKAACADAGAACTRVDEQTFTGNILNKIYSELQRADLVIADMTGRNANVYYEVGYAHALHKRVMLLTQDADDIPFDLQHYPHVTYGQDTRRAKVELLKKIRWWIANPREHVSIPAERFPWPQLMRRGMALLEETLAFLPQLQGTRRGAKFVQTLHDFAGARGATGAPDIQLSVADANRKFLYHDYRPHIGRAAPRVGGDGQNIYDDIFRHHHGAVSWVDWISNIHHMPAARMNIALYDTVGDPALKVIVELHDEVL